MQSLRRQRGLSLVELLVSMALGLVVVGAVILTYIGSGASGARQAALAQMQEDVQLAFNIVSRDLQMAGYSEPLGITVSGGAGTTATFSRKFTGRPIFACSTPMTTPSVALTGANEDGVACSVGGSTASHSLVVNFEATSVNSVVNATNTPTNCLGSVASSVVAGSPTVSFFLVSNRYYVSSSGASGRPELSCAGPGAAGQPLIENVEAMRLWLGQNNAANPKRPVRYVAPSDVAAADWGTVVAVRICLLMRSAEPVLVAEDDKSYLDCNGATQTSADRRLRRAFFSTVALRNKTAF